MAWQYGQAPSERSAGSYRSQPSEQASWSNCSQAPEQDDWDNQDNWVEQETSQGYCSPSQEEEYEEGECSNSQEGSYESYSSSWYERYSPRYGCLQGGRRISLESWSSSSNRPLSRTGKHRSPAPADLHAQAATLFGRLTSMDGKASEFSSPTLSELKHKLAQLQEERQRGWKQWQHVDQLRQAVYCRSFWDLESEQQAQQDQWKQAERWQQEARWQQEEQRLQDLCRQEERRLQAERWQQEARRQQHALASTFSRLYSLLEQAKAACSAQPTTNVPAASPATTIPPAPATSKTKCDQSTSPLDDATICPLVSVTACSPARPLQLCTKLLNNMPACPAPAATTSRQPQPQKRELPAGTRPPVRPPPVRARAVSFAI